MFENINLNQTVSKKVYKSEIKLLEDKLEMLQQQIQQYKIPIMIVFEGWSASGKGALISKIVYPLDPRRFNVYTMGKLSEESQLRPFLWAYATKTPAQGRISIYDKSWHRVLMSGKLRKLSDEEKEGFYYDVNAFERQLADSGMVIIKFFLHISKEEQKQRFKDLMKNPDTRWQVDDDDIHQNDNYDKYLQEFENLIYKSNFEESRWSVIESNDKRFATLEIYKILIGRIEEEIAKRKQNISPETDNHELVLTENRKEVSILKSIDLSKSLSKDEYSDKIDDLQKRISELGFKLYKSRRSVIIAYEGWDAAGKGGNIKRLTEELDPRAYEVVPISAPTQEELSHHYLWRFYKKLPKDGHFAIFDRTWYGRVMVERIEGFCTQAEWQRAYKEINDMEQHLANHGTIIFKFWLHIDKDEQLARFNAREADELKKWKITEEDWRNREKWDQYERAVDEMLFRTNTPYAPWTIIESNCKRYARIKVLEIVVEELEKRLK